MNKTIIKRAERHGRNNNVDNNYFYKSKYSIHTSIDYIILSNINSENETLLYDILNSNKFKVVKDARLEKGNYYMKRVYRNAYGNTVDICHHQIKKTEIFNSLLVTIHHPNEEIMSLLDSVFRYHNINPKVSKIELTFDFHVDDAYEFFDQIKNHLFLKNQRSDSFMYGEFTFYTNNIRKSVKGMRLYIKPKKHQLVRLELVLHRQIIKRLGLKFPLNDIGSIILSKFFYFASLKEDDFKEYMRWKNRRKMKHLFENDPFEEELVESIVESWFNHKNSFMGKIEAMRDVMQIKNYSRFIEPLDDFNKKFLDAVSSQKFISLRGKNDDFA